MNQLCISSSENLIKIKSAYEMNKSVFYKKIDYSQYKSPPARALILNSLNLWFGVIGSCGSIAEFEYTTVKVKLIKLFIFV